MTPRKELAALEAAGGLRLRLFEEDSARIAWGEPDWLGPVGLALEATGPPALRDWAPFDGEDDLGRFTGLSVAFEPLPFQVRTSVRAYQGRPLLVFRSEALEDLAGLAPASWRARAPCVVSPAALRGRAAGGPRAAVGINHELRSRAERRLVSDFFLFPNRPAVGGLADRAGRPLVLLAP